MAATVETAIPAKAALDQKLARSPGLGGIIIFGLILAVGMFYAASHRLVEGSVAEKVLRTAPCPILAVRQE